MILSFENRFAFIKVQKTAGTSVEVFLSPLAGADAIVTPIKPPEAGHEPRNFERRDGDFFNHMPASLVRDRVGAEQWRGLYRFCFERNPWDKAISFYFWRTKRRADPPPFEVWAAKPGNLVSERDLYTIDGALAVDYIGRYETLSADLQSVLDHVGIKTSIELPRAKSEHRPVGERTPIGVAADALIRTEFAWEIDHFGYTRPDRIPWE
jgi:hypothetical protein